MKIIELDITFRCPRRDEGGPMAAEGTDRWRDWGTFRREEHDDPQPDDGYLSCSYCGSMLPRQFFELWLDNGEVGPTDKSYKAYFRHPSLARGQAKVYFPHFDDADRERFCEIVNDIPDERRMDESRMTVEPGQTPPVIPDGPRIGFPGHFYRRPYFVSAP